MAGVNQRNFSRLTKTLIIAQTRHESLFGRRHANRSIAWLKLCAKAADKTWKDRKSGLSTVPGITHYFLKIPMEISWRSAVAGAQSLRTEADQGKIKGVSFHGCPQDSASAKPRSLSQA